MQYAFGAGSLWGIPGVTNPTPARFGAVQQLGVDFNANIVNLFGSYQFPLATARGTVKIDGSGKFAQLNGRMLNDIFFSNSTLATGKKVVVDREAIVAIPATPFQITVTHAGATCVDLGVNNAADGTPFVRVDVGGTPAAGQYTHASGVYTFASADNVSTISVQISYSYTTTGGETLTMSNALMGVAPAFTAVMSLAYDAKYTVLTLNKAIAAKLTIQSALEDFIKPDFSFGAFSDSSNVIGTWVFSEAS